MFGRSRCPTPFLPDGPNVTPGLRLSPRKGSMLVFQMLACNVACLFIASLYYAWRDVYLHRRKRAQLHDRVAYMLWVAASRVA